MLIRTNLKMLVSMSQGAVREQSSKRFSSVILFQVLALSSLPDFPQGWIVIWEFNQISLFLHKLKKMRILAIYISSLIN